MDMFLSQIRHILPKCRQFSSPVFLYLCLWFHSFSFLTKCLSILGDKPAVCAINIITRHTKKSQVQVWKETNVAFLECSVWYGSAVANFHNETVKRALPYQCTASWAAWMLSGSLTLCFAHTSLKEITKSGHVRDRQVKTECKRYCMNHHLPELALNPSLPVFAVYQHAIKDDLSLFTTNVCFGSWISLCITNSESCQVTFKFHTKKFHQSLSFISTRLAEGTCTCHETKINK